MAMDFPRITHKYWRVLYSFLVVCAAVFISSCERSHPEFKDGDIIFQRSRSGQSQAIALATHSEWTHCGLLYNSPSGWMVLEAVEPVKLTPVKAWIGRGAGGRYVVKRLKDRDKRLTRDNLNRMKAAGQAMMGKHYDLGFGWSDNRIYCSELIWKIYDRGADVEVGRLNRLSDFDLSNSAVKSKLKERYGDTVPLQEPVISPQAIFEWEGLDEI